MIGTLLDKLYKYPLEEERQAVVNILTAHLTDLQYQALMEIDAEVDDHIAEINEPPDEEEIKQKHPGFCEGCEE